MIERDTIVAISTPLGEGGIGIVRASGKDAVIIVDKLFSSPREKRLAEEQSHRLTYGFIRDPLTGITIDEVLVSVMRAPHTYTKEDVVEINCHGGMLPLRTILELVLKHGARLAEPGEFTKRAFLHGRLDLSQAEAVIDIIRAKTDESRMIALKQLSGGLSEKIVSLRDRLLSSCAHIEAYIDFPEDDIEPASKDTLLREIREIQGKLLLLSKSFDEGRFFREGLRVAIVGRPNVGKSSLLNALLNRDRAIVTEMPGTTRDVLEEYLNIKGLPVRIMDTAGIRETHEMAEREGVMRSLRALDDADIVIGLVDGTFALSDQDRKVLGRIKEKNSIIAINKSDLIPAGGLESSLRGYSERIVRISARSGAGLDNLKDLVVQVSMVNSRSLTGGRLTTVISSNETDGVMVTNVRHKVAIDHAIDALNRASDAFTNQPLEITAIEMRDALDRLGEIVGAVTTEDILDRIFSEFCIGK
jgi:tRNA modification GTPase